MATSTDLRSIWGAGPERSSWRWGLVLLGAALLAIAAAVGLVLAQYALLAAEPLACAAWWAAGALAQCGAAGLDRLERPASRGWRWTTSLSLWLVVAAAVLASPILMLLLTFGVAWQLVVVLGPAIALVLAGALADRSTGRRWLAVIPLVHGAVGALVLLASVLWASVR